MTNELLPLGSIIYLEEATTKLMIVGRGPIFESDGENVYSDYVGIIYPEGINPDDAIFFNHENIEKVVFEGYKDEEEERFMEVYKSWESELEVKKVKMQAKVLKLNILIINLNSDKLTPKSIFLQWYEEVKAKVEGSK